MFFFSSKNRIFLSDSINALLKFAFHFFLDFTVVFAASVFLNLFVIYTKTFVHKNKQFLFLCTIRCDTMWYCFHWRDCKANQKHDDDDEDDEWNRTKRSHHWIHVTKTKAWALLCSSKKSWNVNKVDDNVSNKSDLWHLRSQFVCRWEQKKNVHKFQTCLLKAKPSILLWSICLLKLGEIEVSKNRSSVHVMLCLKLVGIILSWSSIKLADYVYHEVFT